MCSDPHYFMIEYNDYDPEKDKVMAITAKFHGPNFKANNINQSIQSLKENYVC